MNEKNELKLKIVKKYLSDLKYFYTEYANGQLQIEGVNLWATTEKWHDSKTGKSGVGVNSCLKYINEKR